MAFDTFFTNPLAALGYGLLTSSDNPIGTGFDVLLKSTAAKDAKEERDYRRIKELKDEEAKTQERAALMEALKDPNALRTFGVAYNNPAAVTAAGQMRPNWQYNPELMDYANTNSMNNPMAGGGAGTIAPPSPVQMTDLPPPAPVNLYEPNPPSRSTLRLSPKAQQNVESDIQKKEFDEYSKIKTSYDEGIKTNQLYSDLIPLVEKAPDAMFGVVAGRVANQTSPVAQQISSMANQLVLAEKQAKQMGSQGFTDQDREFLKHIVGGLTMEKPATLAVLSRAQKVIDDANKLGEQKIGFYEQQGTLRGFKPINAPQGARLAPDGNYYIQKDGKYYQVVE